MAGGGAAGARPAPALGTDLEKLLVDLPESDTADIRESISSSADSMILL